jgi:hypothetical protein
MQLEKKESKELERAIVDVLTPFPETPGHLAGPAIGRDVTSNSPVLRAAIEQSLVKKGLEPPPFQIAVEQPDPHTYVVETDLGQQLGLDAAITDKVIEQALLAIAHLNQRVEEMQTYKALSGFRDDDYRLLDEKLRFLFAEVDSSKQEARLDRVVELADLPDPETAAGSVDVNELLKIRDSDLCREFRQWLRTLDDATDQEIEDQLRSLREALSRAVRSPIGRTVRFLTTSGIGAVPVIGYIVGPALSALDTFVLERLLPEPGPVSFLSSSYPSIFKG